jgi:riboflavin kinase/FMN adenylyltransferase
MRLIHTTDTLTRARAQASRVVAIGVFDGVHIGHQAILEEARSLADESRSLVTAFTFEPMPGEFFRPDNPPPRLTRFRERFELLASHGVDELFCPRFESVRRLTSVAFIDELLIGALNATGVVVGDDFRFGAGRQGGSDDLVSAGNANGFSVRLVPPVLLDGERVSSTAIRRHLGAGDLSGARRMLGRDYSISGRVVRGLGLGRALGFPTANVNLKRRLAAVDGIFAVRVSGIGERLLDGVASVGTRPTVGGGKPLLEVLIFDFDENIYGRQITVHFIERLREERMFPDIEAMRAQMALDVDAARAALAA